MLPSGAPLNVFLGVVWLKVVLVFGALYALVGHWSLMHWGRRSLIPVWANATFLCAFVTLVAMDSARSG